MSVTKRLTVAIMIVAMLVVGGVLAQVTRPVTPRPVPNRNTQTPPDVPKEINMQNPIPDCEKYMAASLFKEAFDALQTWTLDPAADPMTVGQGFGMAIACLQNLNRVSEMDEYRDQVIEAHRKNWRLLMAAAQSLESGIGGNYGSIIDGKFVRSNYQGERVTSQNRDHVQALLLMQEAMPLALEDSNKSDVADFFTTFARMFRNRAEAWKMQALTDLSGALPDYEKQDRFYGRYGGGNESFAPVDEAGEPVYYRMPEAFESAAGGGGRGGGGLAMMGG
ncbi:MAG: hypothetical protein FWH27_12140, partial [Planctomycetaceae bacterium]|nr:hypothetical protein [Planctomycetaceae bacterium]